ncbi:MAG TPA: STAS domain-containing protein [Oceanobacillus sp.]|nr:STAS domain-containing protein [Oceanobacillus sp.]
MIDFQISRLESITLVELIGRVDSSNANLMGDALNHEIDNGNVNLVLDLSRVDYMSSAGLRELVSAYKKVKRLDGDVRLVQPSPRVQEILELAGLDTVFQTFATPLEAARSY